MNLVRGFADWVIVRQAVPREFGARVDDGQDVFEAVRHASHQVRACRQVGMSGAVPGGSGGIHAHTGESEGLAVRVA